jgi:glutamine synthetase
MENSMDRRRKIESPQEVLALCREKDVRAVDLRFTDFLGRLHHLTLPVRRLTEAAFEEGFGFDGSSIRCWKSVDESDLLLVPIPSTVWIDPFAGDTTTLAITCVVQDPITREEYSMDPRNIARRAENYLASTGIADQAFFGPEAEFFIFDEVRFDQSPRSGFYEIDSVEAAWNSGTEGDGDRRNLGHKIRYKDGYFPCPPLDQTVEIRNAMMEHMLEAGIEVECHHHEVATAGQAEIDFCFGPLVETADTVMRFKHIAKNVAKSRGKTVTFMPKPVFSDNGSGMHVHFSLWKAGDPLFAGSGYAGLSDLGMHAIGGLLKHAPALLALTNPTSNSFKRLVPGFEAPVNLAYSQRNRSAACRIPMSSPSPKAKRVEFRCPDPSCNPYLAFSAMLMAIIDGVQNKLHPGDPMEKDLYDLPPETNEQIAKTPADLEASLQALENDSEFLLRGDVFSEEALLSWIRYKREYELRPLSARPHPYEFCMYYDV